MATIKDIEMRDGNKLPIRQFKLTDMVENPAIIMIAKRGSGKSWVVRAIMHHFRKIPCGIIIAPTDRMNPFYNVFFPDTYIHYAYKTETIQKLLQRQTDIIEKSKNREKRGGKFLDARTYIVMDDCLSSKGTWMRDQPIQELLYNGRHYKIMYILTMQYPLGITPELRTNFDYIFLLKEEYISNQKKLFDHYAGMFPNLDSFRQVFGSLTQDNGCMVIDNRRKANNSLERLFWFRANDLTGIKVNMGCSQFRKYHENNYNKDWRTSQKSFDFGSFCNNLKKSKSVIEVAKEEVDDNGNVVNQREKSLKKFNKMHKDNNSSQKY
jgi:hypothetical protein